MRSVVAWEGTRKGASAPDQVVGVKTEWMKAT